MAFNNPTVSISELPQSENIELLRLDRQYAPLKLASVIIVELVLLIIGGTFLMVRSESWALPTSGLWVLLVVLGLVIFLYIAIHAWLSASVIRYALRQHDLVVVTGIFWRSETIQPLRRVQHVELTRGPLDKRFGLANVRVFSAGTGLSTFIVPGIALKQAEKIRAFILDYQEHNKTEPESQST